MDGDNADSGLAEAGHTIMVPETSIAHRNDSGVPIGVLDTLIGRETHNFDGDKLAVWKLTALACGSTVKGFDDLPKDPIVVKYYYAHPVEMTDDKTGEIRETIRCVLITTDNQAYGFVSDGIALDLARLANVFGNRPFDPPIPLKVSVVKTRQGFRMYKIDPVL